MKKHKNIKSWMEKHITKHYMYNAALILIVMFISVGYTAFKQEIKIKELNAKARFENEVRITSIENVPEETSAGATSINDFNKTKIITDLTLPNSDSYITYKIEISNFGAVKAGLYSIDNLPNNLEIKSIEGYNLKTAICNTTKCTLGARVEFKIKIGYKAGMYNSNSTTTPVLLNFNFGEVVNVTYNGIDSTNLPKEAIKGYSFEVNLPYNNAKITMNGIKLTESEYSYTNGKLTIQKVDGDIAIEKEAKLTNGTYFKNRLGTYRANTTQISFVTNSNMNLSSITNPIDVSEDEDGSVLAYIQNDTSNAGKYKIIVATRSDTIYFNQDSGYMFSDFSSLASLDLTNISTSKVTNMCYMFQNCTGFIVLDFTSNNLTNFDTSKVVNMEGLFAGCSSLNTLNLSSFDTSQVSDMIAMFSGCSSLTSLNISSFETSKVTSMMYMFYNCNSLTSLNISNFNTSNVTSMSNMFDLCSSLTSLNVGSFNTSKVTNMAWMFSGCSRLTSLNLSNFNTSNVTGMLGMFSGCSSLTSLNISSFNTSKVTNMYFMFRGCSSLTSLNVGSFNTAGVTNMLDMFSGCSKLTSLDLSKFNTSKVANMSNMFSGCTRLTTIYVSGLWNNGSVTNSSNMFKDCSALRGAVAFNSSRIDYSMANYTTGYFTYKAQN